jgi:hypothetical protein
VNADRELWLRARSLFDELVDLAPDRRESRLIEVRERDPALSSAVERLLDADSSATRALSEYHFGPSDAADATGMAGGDPSGSHDPLGIVGRTVSHFTLKKFLAAGGMGVVYTAEDVQLGRTVALKFPLPHQRMDPAVANRFMQEARAAATLDHPNLCAIHEVGESAHGVFLAMPLYSGETLGHRLAREHALAPVQVAAILQQVLAGLAAAHAANIVHRDLKPGNVMLLPDGTAKILDFGLAKVRDVGQTRSKVTLGTVAYMAPEQIRRQPVDARTDLWAIGVMLYEMLTGRPPFEGEYETAVLHAVLHDDPPLPSRLVRALPPAFDAIVAGLLQKAPAHRYASADAVRADLDAAMRGATLSHRSPFWTRTAGRRRARGLALPGAAGVVGLCAVALLAWYGARRESSSASSQPVLHFVDNTAVIGSSAELLAALTPANSGRRIHLKAGAYDIRPPLVVPDSMTLEGEGVMLFDATGHPTGFRAGTATVLQVVSEDGGEALTLGDGVTLRNIEIGDRAGRSGNVIGVVSRRPRDHVSVTLMESVIVNPNPASIGGGGQLGASLRILTENPNLGADPAPHDGSALSVKVARSVFRASAGGIGWFAFNFAPNSRIALELSHNVIGGENLANGGVSRPDAVHDSEVRIVSDSNVYRDEWEDPCASPLIAWNFTGGSGAPLPVRRLAATVRNALRVRSVGDRIERYTTGVLATGSRRFFGDALNAPPAENLVELQLLGTMLSTASCAARVRVVDLDLAGAATQENVLDAGDGNALRVELRGVSGSGARANRYADARLLSGTPAAVPGGKGNRLLVVGGPVTFARENRGIDPAPDARFFIGTPARRDTQPLPVPAGGRTGSKMK